MAILESLGNGIPSVFVQCPPLEHDDRCPSWMINAEGSEPSLREAIDRLSLLPRHVPPADLISHYGIGRMVAAYDDLYESLCCPPTTADGAAHVTGIGSRSRRDAGLSDVQRRRTP